MDIEIQRPSLLDEIMSFDGPVVLRAPIGFGKSVVARHLERNCGGALHREVIAASSTEVLSRIRSDGTRQRRLITTRSVRDHTGSTAQTPDRVDEFLELGPDALRFGRFDIEALLNRALGPSEDSAILAEIIERASGGWPVLAAAYVSALHNLDSELRVRSATQLSSSGEVLTQIVSPILERVTPERLANFASLVTLGPFTEELLVAAAGERVFFECETTGFPLTRRSDGLLEVLPVVGAYLLTRSPDAATVRRIAPLLARTGRVLHALRLLVRTKEFDAAADVLCSQTRATLESVPSLDLVGISELLRRHCPVASLLGVIEARALANLGRLDEAAAVLEAVGNDPRGDLRGRNLAKAELLLALASTDHRDELLNVIDQQIDIAGSDPETHATLLTAKGICLANKEELSRVWDSELVLLIAARLWESLGESLQASRVLRQYASMTLGELGRFGDVTAVIAQALVLAESDQTSIMLCHLVLTRAAAYAGDLDHFESSRLRIEELLLTTDLTWARGYQAWANLLAAAWRKDRGRVVNCLFEAENLLRPLLTTRSGAVFLAEASESLTRTGLLTQAQEYLDRAMAHPEGKERDARFAVLALASRNGSLRATRDAADRAMVCGPVSPNRAWRILADVASAELRHLGSIDNSLMRQLKDAAGAAGDEEKVALVVAEVRFHSESERKNPIRIVVLGGFSVERQGELIAVPDGRASLLLKLLASRRGSAPTDLVIEILWPEIEPQIGRRRLKNVIRRLRLELGAESVWRNRSTVALGPAVCTDHAEFVELARSALLSADPPTARRLATLALKICPGDLLPDDLYDDWVIDAREAVQSQLSALRELLR